MPKKIKRSIENNLSRNGCTVTSNDTFQMFHIPIKYQKIYCRSSRPEVFCKKGFLKNFAKLTRGHLQNRLKNKPSDEFKNRLQHSGVFL